MSNLDQALNDRGQARTIMNIYRFYGQKGTLYLEAPVEVLDALFDAVVDAINDLGTLKAKLPYNEFVRPCRLVAQGDAGWIGHFQERDNRRFFLSDIYDYLAIVYRV